ncbi:MAG: glycoside hydrolase family 97 protein [Bdellovibrionaceae bacterium]|nr:glycoside hydrolase family 97 protein [Pseudobdellovibrionaceae bacterium]
MNLPVFAFLLSLTVHSQAATLCDTPARTLASPDQKIQVRFCLQNGAPHYAVEMDQKPVLGWSALGFELKDQPALRANFLLDDTRITQHDSTWEQVWGEERFIRDQHAEMTLDLVEKTSPARRLTLIFRAYNDGIAFRYAFPEQEALKEFTIMNELTEFNFTQDAPAWSIQAYTELVYEQIFRKIPLSQIPVSHTPLTIEGDGFVASLHEAALVDYSSMQIKSRGDSRLFADLAPWADGSKVKTRAPMKTPWRTMQLGRAPGDLVTSYLILNLNEPNRLTDTSWIQPMKYMGIWWGMHIGRFTWHSGPRHGATTENAKAYIDAAAQLKMPALLIEGWNIGWDTWGADSSFDYLRSYPDFDLKAVTDYGREKGVEIIGHHETAGDVRHYERQMEEAFRLYRDVGVRSVKTGYVKFQIEGEYHYGQSMVRHYQKVIDLAAKYGIMINAHEPVKDTGLRRTYPNFMTREGGRGTEYEAWDGPVGNPPSHTTVLPFTRGLSGPFDYTPGIFDLLTGSRPGVDRLHTTLAKQLALYVTIYSPMHMAADLPEHYMNHPAFKFIQDVPVDWFTTRVLSADIGQHVTIARKDRRSEDWYIGSITNEQGRNLDITLDFLNAAVQYCAEIYRDTDETNWENNPAVFEVATRRVRRGDHMTLRLAPGGGQAIRLSPCE